jgi:ATP-dependent exoDNAse (exonuclease V) beta subunit
VPAFKGKDTVLERPDMETAGVATVRPGAYRLRDEVTREPYTVVWWDPLALDVPGEERRGLRREHLITKDARPEDVATDRAHFDAWQARRAAAVATGSRPSLLVTTASEWARTEASSGVDAAAEVTLANVAARAARPGGRRFGTLVHGVLAALPLDASATEVADMARVQARLLSAPDTEANAAAALATTVLQHDLVGAARRARDAGRACHRELPLSVVRDGVLIDGQADLAFDDGDEWVVVDFKTDAEIGEAEDAYRRQVALYVSALTNATGRPGRGVLLRV